MSGYSHEFKIARQQGVEFWFNTLPHQISALTPEKISVTLKETLLNQHLSLDVDLILVATGQSKLQNLLSDVPELQCEQGRLKVDPKTGGTGHPKIFAGGDLVNGGMEVVNAVAEGKRAAQAIHEGLKNG
jgi:glutamate synthase (NADPH/NADH) small chain